MKNYRERGSDIRVLELYSNDHLSLKLSLSAGLLWLTNNYCTATDLMIEEEYCKFEDYLVKFEDFLINSFDYRNCIIDDSSKVISFYYNQVQIKFIKSEKGDYYPISVNRCVLSRPSGKTLSILESVKILDKIVSSMEKTDSWFKFLLTKNG